MSTSKKLVLGAVAIVIILVAIVLGLSKDNPLVTGASFPVHNTPEVYSLGLGTGNDGYIIFSKGGNIGPGANQASWHNTTGRTVYVVPENVVMGFNSGTASSTSLFYVATSSASTLTSDFAHPGGSVWAIDGASIATSTPAPSFLVGTTTSDGKGIPIADGAYLNFQVQEAYDCVTVGACETATSTNRGISNYFWRFTGFYQP